MRPIKNKVVIFDFETGNTNTSNPLPIEVAAVVLDINTLEFVPAESGGEFCSGIKPHDFEKRQEEFESEALRVNGKTLEEVAAFPDEKVVWNSFAKFVKKFAWGNSPWNNPIPAGHNIINFDIPIANKLNEKHGIKNFWHCRDFIDTYNTSWLLFQHREIGPENASMDCLRAFLGIPEAKPHTALQDCRDTGRLLRRYLKVIREYSKRTKFEGAMADGY